MASGLPPNIVDQLMEAERIPVKKMEEQKSKQESRLKLIGDLETRLNKISGTIGGLANTHGFTDMKLTSGDEGVVAGAVDPQKAMTGDWNLEVDSLASKSAVITNGFPDKDKTQIGVGYFKFKTPQGEKDVYINGQNNTLQGAANAINTAGVGIRASVINDAVDKDAPYKLILSAEGTGNGNQVEYPTLYFLDGDQDIYFDKTKPAQNGKVKLDGMEFEVSDNTLKDVIPGVTLDLKQAAPGKTINLSVKEDREVVSGKIKDFVDSVNGVLSFIQQQNQLNEHTDTSSTLGGDSLLRSIEQRMRSLIQNPQYGLGGSINRLSQLGVTFNRQGTLDLNQDKFNQVLASDPAAVQKFLAGDGFKTGFAPSIQRQISTLTSSAYGIVGNRKRSLQDRIDQIDSRIANKERMLAQKEDNLRKKFSRLEENMSRLKSQGGALSGMGAAPTGLSGLIGG
jgi:flagellar hook-associated protein 2